MSWRLDQANLHIWVQGHAPDIWTDVTNISSPIHTYAREICKRRFHPEKTSNVFCSHYLGHYELLFHPFLKAPVFKIFFLPHKNAKHTNAKLAFSNSSSFKSVFEKLRLCDRLVSTVDLHVSIEFELCSQNLVSCHLKMDHIHYVYL